MHKDRILFLADRIERLESKDGKTGFNMTTSGDDLEDFFEEQRRERMPSIPCNSVACMAAA